MICQKNRLFVHIGPWNVRPLQRNRRSNLSSKRKDKDGHKHVLGTLLALLFIALWKFFYDIFRQVLWCETSHSKKMFYFPPLKAKKYKETKKFITNTVVRSWWSWPLRSMICLGKMCWIFAQSTLCSEMIFVTKSGLCPHYWGFQQKQKKNKALENLPQNRESFSIWKSLIRVEIVWESSSIFEDLLYGIYFCNWLPIIG